MYGPYILMANKKRNKRKNSSEGDSVKTSKQNKEAKPEVNIVTPKAVGETLSSAIHLQYSPVLPVDMNNSIFGATASTPVYQQIHGQLSYPMSGGIGLTSPPGIYSGIPPTNAHQMQHQVLIRSILVVFTITITANSIASSSGANLDE